MRTYVIFDLDETLFTHRHELLTIDVYDSNNKLVEKLTNQEYNDHHLLPGHTYDYSKFSSSDVFLKSSIPINFMIDKLKFHHKKGATVEIITARADLDNAPKFRKYLKKHGIDANEVHIRRAGNLQDIAHGSERKAHIVKEQIDFHHYDRVEIYDDDISNLMAVLNLRTEYPDINFIAHHIKYSHDTENIVIKTIKR